MGDFMPPGRGCVESDYERQRRRFEKYRQLHAIRRQQYESFTSSAYSQQLHETQMLHKKWLESVASKKPSLAPKSAGKLQPRNEGAQLALPPPSSQPSNATITAKKFKRTANGQFKSAATESPPMSAVPPVAGRNVPDATFAAGFDNNSSPSAGPNMSQQSASGNSNGSNSMHNSLSVNINVDANLHRSQSAIKLTFSSTINGHTTQQQQTMPPTSAPPAGASGSGPSTAPTSGGDGGPQSRQVPMGGPTAAQFNVVDSLGNIEDFDELSDLLDKFEQEEGTDGLPNDILKILDEGIGGFDDFAADGLTHSGGLTCSRETVSAPSSLPRYGPGGPIGFPAGIGSMAGVNVPGYGPLGSGASKIPESCVGIMPAQTASTLLGDTGPAAETLKQMAAQHQNQANAMNRQYNSTGVYGDGFNQGQFPGGAPRLPRYPVHQYSSGYAMPSSMYHCDPRYDYGGMDPTMGGGMGRSVPMEHSRFAAPSGGMASQAPTSLQRLENQVQSHFAPGSGSANGTPSADIPHFRMEQSQRIDVRGSQMAVAQQQSFSMSMDGGVAPGGPACPGPQAAYHRYPQPAAYRHSYPGPAAPSSMRMMPAGYQNVPTQGVMVPGAMQHCSGSGPAGTMMQQQQNLSSEMAPAGVRGPVPSGVATQNRLVPGHRSPAVNPSLPTKVESAPSYPCNEQAAVANSAGHDMKSGNLQDGPMSGIQASQSHTAPSAKASMAQRSPYMSVGMPTGHVLDGGYSQMGKWMPRGGPNHAMPPGVMRNSYAGGYAAMADPIQPNAAGQLNMIPMELQNNPRWSVAVSQSQSIFVSGGGGSMGSGVYHPNAMMDTSGYSRLHPPQHAGYGQNVGFYNSGSSGMMAGSDAMPRTSADFLHRNSGPSNVEYDAFSANRCPPMVPEFACIDDVFK